MAKYLFGSPSVRINVEKAWRLFNSSEVIHGDVPIRKKFIAKVKSQLKIDDFLRGSNRKTTYGIHRFWNFPLWVIQPKRAKIKASPNDLPLEPTRFWNGNMDSENISRMYNDNLESELIDACSKSTSLQKNFDMRKFSQYTFAASVQGSELENFKTEQKDGKLRDINLKDIIKSYSTSPKDDTEGFQRKILYFTDNMNVHAPPIPFQLTPEFRQIQKSQGYSRKYLKKLSKEDKKKHIEEMKELYQKSLPNDDELFQLKRKDLTNDEEVKRFVNSIVFQSSEYFSSGEESSLIEPESKSQQVKRLEAEDPKPKQKNNKQQDLSTFDLGNKENDFNETLSYIRSKRSKAEQYSRDESHLDKAQDRFGEENYSDPELSGDDLNQDQMGENLLSQMKSEVDMDETDLVSESDSSDDSDSDTDYHEDDLKDVRIPFIDERNKQ